MAGEEAAGAERYENIHGDRYEDIQGTESFITNQVRRESISTSRNLSLGIRKYFWNWVYFDHKCLMITLTLMIIFHEHKRYILTLCSRRPLCR